MFRKLVLGLTIISLFNMQITGFGFISPAQAQTVSASSSDTLLMNSDIKTQPIDKTRSESKAKSQERVKQYEGLNQPTGIQKTLTAAGFVEMLTMLVIGQIGKSVMFACTGVASQMEMMLFIGGAAAYVAGEIQAWLRYKASESVRMSYTEGALTGQQRKSLEGEREDYKQMLAISKTKYTLQMAAAAAFAAAAASAGYKYYTTEISLKKCQASLMGLKGTCSTQCSALVTGAAACMAAAEPCLGVAELSVPEVEALDKKGQATFPSLHLFTPLTLEQKMVSDNLTRTCAAQPCATAVAAQCVAALTGLEMTWVSCKPQAFFTDVALDFIPQNIKDSGARMMAKAPPKAIDLKEDFWSQASLDRLAKRFFDLALPKANAAGSIADLFGIAGAAYSLYLGTKQVQAGWFDSMVFHPMKRSIMFGVCAALATVVAGMTKGNMSKIEEHIAKIDAILNKMGTAATTTGLTAIDQNARIPIALPVAGSKISAAFPCVMVGNSKKGCGSMSSAVSNIAKENTLRGFTLDSLGSATSQLGQLSGKFVDSIQGQGTLSQGALGTAGEMASKNAIAQKLMTDTYKSIDDQLKKNSLAPLGLADLNKKMLANVQNATFKALQAKGVTPVTAAAAFGMLDPITKDEQKKAGAIDEKSIAALPATGGGVAVQSGLPSFGGDLVPNEEGINKGDVTTTNAAPEGAVMDMTKAGDINNNSDTSIFDILTQRYFKTGLDKLGIQKKAENEKNIAPEKAP